MRNNKLIEFLNIHHFIALFFSIRGCLSNPKNKDTKTRIKVFKLKTARAFHFVKYFVNKVLKIICQKVNS